MTIGHPLVVVIACWPDMDAKQLLDNSVYGKSVWLVTGNSVTCKPDSTA